MLSLDNAFTDEDVRDFVGRIRRFLRLGDDEPIAFTAEPKIDGLSIVAALRDGGARPAAPRAATAATARTSPPICATHRTTSRTGFGAEAARVIEVRGEVYMTKTAFLDLNRKQAAAGAALRQSAQYCGRLAAPDRSLDHRVAAARLLRLCLGRDERDAGGHPIRHGQMVRVMRL